MLHEKSFPDSWKDVKRVVVIQLGSLGDVIASGLVLRALKQTISASKITLITSPSGSSIVPWMPWVDETWVHQTDKYIELDQEMHFIQKLQQSCFDAAVILTNGTQSPYPIAYCCYLAGIPIRLGQSQEFGGGVLSQWIKPSSNNLHPIDRHLELLKLAGFVVTDRHIELRVPAEIQPQVKLLLQRMERLDCSLNDGAIECLTLLRQARQVIPSTRI